MSNGLIVLFQSCNAKLRNFGEFIDFLYGWSRSRRRCGDAHTVVSGRYFGQRIFFDLTGFLKRYLISQPTMQPRNQIYYAGRYGYALVIPHGTLLLFYTFCRRSGRWHLQTVSDKRTKLFELCTSNTQYNRTLRSLIPHGFLKPEHVILCERSCPKLDFSEKGGFPVNHKYAHCNALLWNWTPQLPQMVLRKHQSVKYTEVQASKSNNKRDNFLERCNGSFYRFRRGGVAALVVSLNRNLFVMSGRCLDGIHFNGIPWMIFVRLPGNWFPTCNGPYLLVREMVLLRQN